MEAVRTTARRKNPERQRTRKRGRLDFNLIVLIMILLIFGLIMVYSTSYYTASQSYGDAAYWLKRQGAFASLGFVIMLVLSHIDYHVWRKYTWPIYFVVLGLLVYVLINGVEVNGAKRWIKIVGITMQPSEVAKLGLIMVFASLLDANVKRIKKLKNLIYTGIFVVPIIALVGIENLSTAIILTAIAGIMLYIAISDFKMILIPGAAAGVMVAILFSLKGYRSDRIAVWLDPESSEKGYQTMQSLYAIGSGGLVGKGLGQSLQKLGFIPEAHNDMIFSIVCEEFGFIGAVGIIFIFLVILFKLFQIVINAQDLYGALLVSGTFAHIGIQVLINVAVVTNTMPNTGVPLPFISYGGTSVCFLLAEMGLVLSVARTMQRGSVQNG